MTKERLFRRNDEVGALDWRRAASDLEVDLEAARLLYEYALNVALGDPQRAASVYLSALYSHAEAERAVPALGAPGRLTRAAYEASPGKHWTPDELAQLPTGKFTRVQIETTREDKFPGYDEWRMSTEVLSAAVQSASSGAAANTASAQAEVHSGNGPAVPAQERRAASAPAPVISRRRAADEMPRPHPFGARGAKRVPGARPAASPVAEIAAPAVSAPEVSSPTTPAAPPVVVAARVEHAAGPAAAPAPASEVPHQLRAMDTPVPHVVQAAGLGTAGRSEHAELANDVQDPAIVEPTAESLPHPVDAFRTNARGLAADLTLAGVGIGRTAARLLRRAAAGPVGRRAAELADAWTGGAAQAWTARARGWAEGAARRAMAFHERMAGPSATDQLAQLPQSGGAPLPAELRARLEKLFGHRLAHVRIHTDASAAQAAEAAGARAVTMGSHVYFARGQFAPGTAAGDRLLVHELTHVVQHDRGQLAQPAGPGVELSSPSDPAEHEARAMEDRATEALLPDATLPGVGERAAVELVDVAGAGAHASSSTRAQPVEAASSQAHAGVGAPVRPAAATGPSGDAPVTGPSGDAPVTGRVASGNWLTDKYHQAKDWAGEKLDDFENWAEDKAMGLVTKVAPGIATLIQEGPGGLIKNAIEPAISSWVGSITGGVNVGQIAGQLKGTFTSAFAVLQGAKAGDPRCCDTLVSGINAIREVAQAFVHNPVFQAIKGVFEKVSGIVETVAKLVAGPVFDVLKTIVGGAWDAITSVASTIQKWFNAVKNVAAKAFDWVARKLGFSSGTGEGGLLDWLKQKAIEIWENIKKTLQPVLGPLKVVAGVLLMFTGLPEIYAIIKYGPQIVEAVQWLWANRNNPEAVKKNPGLLGGSILPKILGAGQSFVGMVKKGVGWLVEKTTSFASGALQLLGAITGVPLLGMARGFVQTIVDGVKGMQEWAAGAFTSAVGWIEGTFHKVVDFIKPYAEVLCSVAMAVTNPAMIPVILAGWAWRWLPDCIKPPLIDLLLDAVIGFLSHMPSLPLLGPLWPLLKSGVLGFLGALRARDPATKIKVSNKLAKIISGASPLFLLGFVKGLLKGVWDGIKMPFEAIWLIAKGIGKAGDFFVALGSDANQEASKHAAPAAAGPGKPAPLPTARALPSVPSVIQPGAASSIVSGIVGQLNAQKQPAATPGAPGATPATGDANQYRQLGQDARRMGGELAGPAKTVATGFWPAVQQLFSGGKGMSLDGLIAKLRVVWNAATNAVSQIGAKIANMICDFLVQDSAEEQIGETIGYLVGMIAFQALLDYLSAGTWTGAMAVLSAIAKFLNWPMKFLGEAMGALKKLGGFILDGLKSLGKMVAEAGAGALREVTAAFGEIGTKLGEFADELLAKFGKNAGEADAAAAHAAEGDAARAAEGDAARTAEGEGAKKPGEGEGKPTNEGKTAAEKEALKAEELAEALEISKVIATAEDAGHVPGPLIALSLDALKARYAWIKSYEADPNAAGYEIFLIASKFTVIQAKARINQLPADVQTKFAAFDDATLQRLATLDDAALHRLAALDSTALAKLVALDEKALANFATLGPADLARFGELDPAALKNFGSLRSADMLQRYANLTPEQLQRFANLDRGTLEKFAGWAHNNPDPILQNIAKQTDETIETLSKLKVQPESKAINASAPFDKIRLNAGSSTYQIDRKSITHVLERHHPDYWIGEVKATQSFLPKNMTPADIADVIQEVFAQNREEIVQRGIGYYQVEGTSHGMRWTLGLNNGRTGQLYPMF